MCFFLTACGSIQTQKNPQPAIPTILPATNTLTLTVSPTVTVTSTPIASQEAQASLSIVDVCPSPQIVPLKDLNLPAEFRLIVLPPEIKNIHGYYDIGYSVLSLSGLKPNAINVSPPPAGSSNEDYRVSPNSEWVSFVRSPKSDPGNQTLWVSSLDGKKQWAVKQFTDEIYLYAWISAEEIVISGSREYNDSETYSSPLVVINPFDRKEQQLIPYSIAYDGRIQDEAFAFRLGTMYDLFEIKPHDYFLHSYQDNTSERVFQWLDELGDGNDNEEISFYDNSFIVTVQQRYGFDISPSLDISEIGKQTEYAKVMKKIVLPKELHPLGVWAIPHSRSVLLFNYFLSPEKWYALDYQEMKLKKYCFASAVDASPILSPDGRFIAFSRDSSIYPSGEITILNLTTGQIAVVKGYQMIDWGVQP